MSVVVSAGGNIEVGERRQRTDPSDANCRTVSHGGCLGSGRQVSRRSVQVASRACSAWSASADLLLRGRANWRVSCPDPAGTAIAAPDQKLCLLETPRIEHSAKVVRNHRDISRCRLVGGVHILFSLAVVREQCACYPYIFSHEIFRTCCGGRRSLHKRLRNWYSCV